MSLAASDSRVKGQGEGEGQVAFRQIVDDHIRSVFCRVSFEGYFEECYGDPAWTLHVLGFRHR